MRANQNREKGPDSARTLYTHGRGNCERIGWPFGRTKTCAHVTSHSACADCLAMLAVFRTLARPLARPGGSFDRAMSSSARSRPCRSRVCTSHQTNRNDRPSNCTCILARPVRSAEIRCRSASLHAAETPCREKAQDVHACAN